MSSFLCVTNNNHPRITGRIAFCHALNFCGESYAVSPNEYRNDALRPLVSLPKGFVGIVDPAVVLPNGGYVFVD